MFILHTKLILLIDILKKNKNKNKNKNISISNHVIPAYITNCFHEIKQQPRVDTNKGIPWRKSQFYSNQEHWKFGATHFYVINVYWLT